MGACLSAAPAHVLEHPDGTELDYQKRFLEEEILGQGEFGTVKLVRDLQQPPDALPLACKILQKGVVFRDNVLYTPLKPQVLRGEVEMLRTLAGQCFCLPLVAAFEAPRLLYMVTEYCAGGQLMEYVASQTEDLRTEDVSRIAFQLLSAVDHCAKHKIIHRDIKPENIMFQDLAPRADLRLIDFGSGVMDKRNNGDKDNDVHTHSTFAGSAFYISPEMFQRTYTAKTDVWSAGVVLYVLVAGYPADSLQVAFNIIHTAHYRNLRQLPNLPNDLPDSFYDLLEQLLNYRHKRRASAGDLLDHEFVAFHQHLENGDLVSSVGLSVEEIAAAAAAGPEFADIVSGTSRTNRTTSMSLRGSVDRHNLFLGFKRFERSLTALLATMLSKKELQTLVNILLERYGTMKQEQAKAADSFPPVVKPATISESNSAAVEGAHDGSQSSDRQQLKVILVRDLRAILQQEFKNATINETIDNLPNADEFGSFAYHASLLDDFCPSQVQQLGRGDGSRHSRGSSIRRNLSIFELQGATDAIFDKDSNGSVRSAGSFRGFRSKNGSRNGSKKNSMTVASASVVANSVHGSTVFVSKNTGEYKNNLAAASSSIRRAQSTALLSKA